MKMFNTNNHHEDGSYNRYQQPSDTNSRPLEWLLSKQKKITSSDENMEKVKHMPVEI